PRRHASPTDQACFDEQLRTVTDRRDGAVRRGEPPHEAHRGFVDPQVIGRVPAGDDERVEALGIGIGDRGVGGDVLLATFAGERFVFLRTEDGDLVTGLAQGVIRFAELGIFELVSEQNCDFRHSGSPWCVALYAVCRAYEGPCKSPASGGSCLPERRSPPSRAPAVRERATLVRFRVWPRSNSGSGAWTRATCWSPSFPTKSPP